jgi:hypothetical protein
MHHLMDRLDGYLDRLTGVLYGPGPYVALRWTLLALLAALLVLGRAAP